MSCGITDPIGCVTDVLGGVGKTVADSAFSAIAHDFGQAADSVVNWLWRQISAATTVTLGGPGFAAEMAITAAIAVTVGVGLFAIQVIVAALRHQPGGLARAGRGLLVAFVAGGLAIGVVDVCLAAVDSLSAGVVQVATGGTITQMGSHLLAPSALSQVKNAAVVILLALVMVAASVVVWAALMVRKLLIIVAAVFAPIAFTGSLSEVTSSWVRRWIETMVALVFSKLILVIIFAIGLGVLTNGVGQAGGGVTQSLTQTITGALILVMAGLSPWLAIKLVHFAGDSFHTVHGQAASTAAGAQMVAAAPRKISSLRPTPGPASAPPSGGAEPFGPAGRPSNPPRSNAGAARNSAGGAGSAAGAPTSSGRAGSASAGACAAAAGAAAAAAAAAAAKTAASTAKTAANRVTADASTVTSPAAPASSPPPPKSADPAGRSQQGRAGS
jgi:type IV secretion system protein TrbL